MLGWVSIVLVVALLVLGAVVMEIREFFVKRELPFMVGVLAVAILLPSAILFMDGLYSVGIWAVGSREPIESFWWDRDALSKGTVFFKFLVLILRFLVSPIIYLWPIIKIVVCL